LAASAPPLVSSNCLACLLSKRVCSALYFLVSCSLNYLKKLSIRDTVTVNAIETYWKKTLKIETTCLSKFFFLVIGPTMWLPRNIYSKWLSKH
jgi:hypothetical protein